jgi:DUF4097 and DUF4098 domain-containing protein YvlB
MRGSRSMRDRAVLRTAVAVVAALVLPAGTAAAQSEIDTTIAVRSGARLSVQNYNGDVVVRGWNRSQIRISAEYDRGRPEIDVTGNAVTIRTRHRSGHDDVTMEISVPANTPVEINGMSVDVDVVDVCGDVNIGTLSGDINVRCATDAQVNSVSGDVALADIRGRVDANATSGSLEVTNVRGFASLHAVSGDISMSGMEGAQVEAETVSGEVDYSGRILENGHYRFSSHSGDVTVRVTGTLNASVETETFSGEMLSDWPIEIQGGTVISKNMSFRLGNGSARLRLSSFSGTINLRRASTSPSREE